MEDHNGSTSNSNGILQGTASFSSNAELSVSSSAFNKSDSIDNSPINTETLKKLWSNSMDGEDCVVVKTPDVNITNFNADDTNYLSICKPTAFNKKHKSNINNDSVMFENALTDDCEMEVTQSSVCSNRFQKRKRLLPSNNDDFVELNRSDNSGIDSAEMSINVPKFQYKKKSNDQSINLPNYSLSSTDGAVVTDGDNSNISKVNASAVFKKPLDSSIFESDCSSVMNASKTEVSANKFTKKNIDVVDTAFDNAINDWSMMSNITSPKNKSLNNISTATLQEISKCKTKKSMQKFTTKNIDEVDDAVFDNAINDSSMISSNITSPKNKSLINISIKNVHEISKSENMSCLNHTYDVPVKCDHLQLGLSQSAKNNNESSNVFAIEPTNETYTLKNDSPTNKSNLNVSLSLGNAKNTLSDTYIIGNNINDTFSQQNSSLQSTNKSTNTLTDISCIHNQPNSSFSKPNFIRKVPLNEVSHNFTLTNDDIDITNSDEINKTKIIESNKFILKKTYQEADSQIFDNIITSSQEMDMSTYELTNCSKNNLSNMASTKIVNNDVSNISPDLRSEKDMDITTDKSSTQQSNIVLGAITENDINISNSLLLKYNTPNSGHRISGKFNFSRQFGRHSLSFQEKRENCHKVKQHRISFSIARNNSKMLNSFHNSTSNIDVESCSKICTIPENDTHTIEHIVSSSPELKSASHEVENNSHELTQSQNNTFQSELHFAGAHNLNAHSGVFSDLIDNSVNSDISLNVSKQVKFKTQQNVSKEADSIVFENIITDTQESNTTAISNRPLSQTILCDQSKMQNDEISIFANIDELWSNKKTPRSAEYSLTKLNPGKILNLEDNGFTDKLSVFNNKSNDSTLKHTANESYEDKLSVMSVVENNTYCEQNYLLLTDKSINIHSPSNTARLSESNSHSYYQTRSISKSLLTPNNTEVSCSSYKTSKDESNLFELDAPKINSNSEMACISKHSINDVSCNGKTSSVLINSFESSKSNGSRKDQLKRTFSLMDSTSSGSNNDGLTLLNTTLESMDIDQSQQNQSKRHSENLTHKQSTSLNSSTKSLRSCNISRNLLESSVSSNNELPFNSSTKSSKSNRSSNQSTSNNSLINITNTNDISNVSNTSLKLEDATNINKVLTSNYGLPENSGLSLLKNTSESSEQKLLFTNQSEKSNLVKLEDRTTNISRMSTRSSKQKDNSTDNISLEVSNINHGQSKSEESIKLINTSAFLEQNKSLLNNSKQSVVFGDETRNDYNDGRISTRSSTQINLSIKNVEPKVLNSSHGISLNEESFKLKNTSLFLEQKEPSLKKSKHFISIVTENETKNDYNDSIISTRLSTQLNHSVQNIDSGVSNISHGLSENKESLKNTSAFLKQKDLSSNLLQKSTSVCLENKIKNDNYNSRISTRSSSRKTQSVKDVSHGLSENEDSLKLQNASLFSEQKTFPLNKLIDNNDSRISNKKLGTLYSTHILSENEVSSKNASAFLKQTELSLNKLQISTWLENAPNDAIIDDRSALSNHFIDNENPDVSNSNIDGHILADEKSPMLNNSSVTSKPINWPLNQHNRCDPIILEDKTNNVSDTSKISSRSSKRKNHSVNEFEPEISVIDDNLKKNKSSLKNSTRVTRSTSLSGSINDPSLPLVINNKSSKSSVNNTSDHSVRYPTNLAYFDNDNVVDETLSTHFSRSSKSGTQYSNVSVSDDTMTQDRSFIKNMADLSNANIDNETDDSIFWTTLSENSTLQSSIPTSVKMNKFQSSYRENDFQTPTTKLSIAERIANKIGNMSESRRKVTHPGAFELLDPINLPLTRSLNQRQATQTPSILSRVLAKNDKHEDLSFSQTSDSVVDQSLVEDIVKEKMKSLYNKEPWITKHLYNFLVSKLQPKYHIYAVKYAEKFMKYLASILNQVYNDKVDLQLYSNMLRYHMARYEMIKDTFDYVEFVTDFIPRPYYDKLMPGWILETSEVKFDPLKNYVPIMEDEKFLREILEDLNK